MTPPKEIISYKAVVESAGRLRSKQFGSMRRRVTEGVAVPELRQEDNRDEDLETQLLAPAVDSSLPATKQDLNINQLAQIPSPTEDGECDQEESGPKRNIYQHENN